YYADTKIDAFSTPIAKAQLAAGLAMLGDKERAALTFAAALSSLSGPETRVPAAGRTDYGTQLRDASAVLALMGEGGAATPQLQKAFSMVTALRAQQRETTTQESLWLLLAARTLDAQNKDLNLEVNGLPVKGSISDGLERQRFHGSLNPNHECQRDSAEHGFPELRDDDDQGSTRPRWSRYPE
ncbi:MAG: hypothetical protein WBX25_31660, partial [Rhodomicrobium sp.]